MPLLKCPNCDWYEVVIFQEHMNKAMREGMKKLREHKAKHSEDD